MTNQVNNQSLIPSTDMIQLTLTLKMTTAQVVETSVTVNNSPIQEYMSFTQTIILNEMTPGFKPFTMYLLTNLKGQERTAVLTDVCFSSVFMGALVLAGMLLRGVEVTRETEDFPKLGTRPTLDEEPEKDKDIPQYFTCALFHIFQYDII